MRYLIILTFVIIGFRTAAQSLIAPEDKNLNWKAKLKKADDLYTNGSFYSAIDYYHAVLDENPGYPDALMGLGMTYYAARDYQSALGNFKQAFDADNDRYQMAHYYWSLMLKMTGDYQKAFDELKVFYRAYRGSDRTMKAIAKAEYDGCTLAMDLLGQVDETVHVHHGGKTINAAYTELSPMYYGSDNKLLYSSLRVEGDSIIRLKKGGGKMPRARVLSADWNGERWTGSSEVDAFNDKRYHTGNVSFSPDGKKAVFTMCTDDKGKDVRCDIYMSERSGGDWGAPELMEFNDKKANNTHPALGMYRGKEAIFFSSDREGTTGGMDIWYTIFERNAWQNPRNLGRRINTLRDEITPYFDIEEDVLYFSSNGLPNVGGFDIFVSKLSGTRWAVPVNIGFPYNSSVDDMYYVHNSKRNRGFFVSNRIGSIALKSPTCCDDIWSFEIIIPPVFTIMGHVYLEGDETMTPIADANVDLYYLHADTTLDIRVSSSDSMFAFFRGTEYENYRLEATKQGFIRGVGTTSTIGLGPNDDTVYVDLYLKLIDTGIIVLRNLYFDLDKAYIRPDAEPSLDTVLQILTKNPNIQIELASHTDCRNTYEYNEDLSQRRADSSKAWLVKRGIPEDRIIAVGYGEQRLLNECECEGNKVVPCTDIQHQVNRRTEFRVVGEIPGAIVRYDKSEVDYAIEHGKRITGGGINQILWNFEDTPEEPEESP